MPFDIAGAMRYAQPVTSMYEGMARRQDLRLGAQAEEMNALKIEAAKNPAPSPEELRAAEAHKVKRTQDFISAGRELHAQTYALYDQVVKSGRSEEDALAAAQAVWNRNRKLVAESFGKDFALQLDDDGVWTPEEGLAGMQKADDLLKQLNPSANTNLTGPLQELEAINRARAERGEPPRDPEEYLEGRRQTSADLQAYNQYLSQLPPGAQALSLEDYTAQSAGKVTGAQARSRTGEERMAAQIDEGFAAADSLPVIRRGLELLDQGVKTGGWNALKLWASNRLGVTGADQGELSANLGKAVLSQLRSTFGAQFTEREGARLAEIEAGFGKSTEANRRLLQQAFQLVERTARRGVLAARRSGDEETARMIEESMNERLDYDREPESSDAGDYAEGDVVVNPDTGERLVLRNNEWVKE
jgi:hypothetical protein